MATRSRLAWLLPIGVFVATLVVFAPAVQNGFVGWDDPQLYTENVHFRGLGRPQLAWMFTTTLMGHYVPVTWLTVGLDYVVWGMNPAGYHLTNVLLHATTAALFWFLALRLLGAATSLSTVSRHVAATTSALFFALHPLRAESVAWITERRDVLSGVFVMLTVLGYLRAVDAGRRDPSSRSRDAAGLAHAVRRPGTAAVFHAAACVTYALAIFSKSIVMTLPVILVLLDVYPLRRLDADWRTWRRSGSWPVWREKIPYAALGAIAVIVAYWAQARGSGLTPLEGLGLSGRSAVAAHSAWFYLAKTVLPFGLSPLYEPPPRIDVLAPQFLLPAVAVVAFTVTLWLLRRRGPAGLAVWLGYLILLAPVSGLVHAGHQLTNDRYSYLPSLPIALLAGSAAGLLADAEGARVRRALRLVAGAAAACWLLALAAMSWLQVQIWKDDEALWSQAVTSEPECSICHVHLGVAFLHQGLIRPAIAELERALALRPDRVKAHLNLGVAFAQLGDLPRAVDHFRSVLARQPDDIEALVNLAGALARQGRTDEAIGMLQDAERAHPPEARVPAVLGLILLDARRPADAVPVLERALTADPTSAETMAALALAHTRLGDRQRAVALHRALAARDPAVRTRGAPAILPVR